jgi:hypothetical protein
VCTCVFFLRQESLTTCHFTIGVLQLGASPRGTQIQSLRMRGPLNLVPGCASYWPSFVSFCPSLCSSGRRWTGWRVLPQNASFYQAHNNCGAHFGYSCRIPWCCGHDVRGVGEACKCIQHSLLNFARVHCLASSAVTPWGHENKWFPLRTLTSSRTINHCLPIFFLLPKERERKESEKEIKIRDWNSLVVQCSTRWVIVPLIS